MMQVSRAETRDIESIVRAAIEFAKSGYPDDECSEDHLWSVVRGAMDSPQSFAAVMKDGGTFAGCFLGSMGPNLLSGKLVCAEIFFWVEPRYRGHGRKLLAYAQSWAKENGCCALALSAPEGAERASKVFMRWGFKPAETWYRKAL